MSDRKLPTNQSLLCPLLCSRHKTNWCSMLFINTARYPRATHRQPHFYLRHGTRFGVGWHSHDVCKQGISNPPLHAIDLMW